jgi:hypothetical protein
MDLEMESEIADAFLLAEPAFQLFGRVGRSIVQNEDDRVIFASKRFRNDDLLDKGLKMGFAASRNKKSEEQRGEMGPLKSLKAEQPSIVPVFGQMSRSPSPASSFSEEIFWVREPLFRLL